MSRLVLRLALLLTAQAGLFALAGCGDQAPVDSPPSAYESGRGAATPPPLAGGPAPFDNGLAGGPRELAPADYPLPPTPRGLRSWREPSGRLVTAMAPIPNPESLSPADRGVVYGEPRRAPVRSSASARPQVEEPPRMAAAAAPRAWVEAPVATPPGGSASAPPRTAPAVRPQTVAPPPAPVIAKPIAPPALSAAVPAMPAPVQTPATRLTAAVGSEATGAATFVTPEALANGEPAQVTLTLPQTLLGAIQREAGKLGLGRAARSAEVTATLSGEGYEITPNGAQTARLKAGEAASFAWQVTPGAGEKSPLKAKIDGALTGLRSPFNFSLGSLEQTIAALQPPAGQTPGLDLPGFMEPGGAVDVPGLGRVPAKTVIGGGLLLLAVIVLAVLARRASEERDRAAARRRYGTTRDEAAPAEAEAAQDQPETRPAEAAQAKDHDPHPKPEPVH